MNDAPWIQDQDNWSNWDYSRIKSMLSQVDTAAINSYADNWNRAGQALAQIVTEFLGELNKTLNGRWSGPAAANMQAVLDSYQQLPSQVSGLLVSVGGLATQISSTVDESRRRIAGVPPPGQTGLSDAVSAGLTSSMVMQAAANPTSPALSYPPGALQRQEANRQAQQVMTSVFAPAYNQVDQSMPTFPPVQAGSGGGGGGGGPTPTPTPPPVGGGGGGGGITGPIVPGPGPMPPLPSGPPGGTLPGPTVPPVLTAPGPVGGPGTGVGPDPGSTTTSGYAPTPPAGGSGTAGGTGGGFGVAGSGGLGGGAGAFGAGIPGGAGRGMGAGARSGAAAGAAAANVAAAAERQLAAAEGKLASGMPMGMAAPAKGSDEEDKEHSSPNYVEAPDGIFGFGDEDVRVAPRVIGED